MNGGQISSESIAALLNELRPRLQQAAVEHAGWIRQDLHYDPFSADSREEQVPPPRQNSQFWDPILQESFGSLPPREAREEEISTEELTRREIVDAVEERMQLKRKFMEEEQGKSLEQEARDQESKRKAKPKLPDANLRLQIQFEPLKIGVSSKVPRADRQAFVDRLQVFAMEKGGEDFDLERQGEKILEMESMLFEKCAHKMHYVSVHKELLLFMKRAETLESVCSRFSEILELFKEDAKIPETDSAKTLKSHEEAETKKFEQDYQQAYQGIIDKIISDKQSEKKKVEEEKKTQKSREEKQRTLCRKIVAELVKKHLTPAYQCGDISKEDFVAIVKKTSEKVVYVSFEDWKDILDPIELDQAIQKKKKKIIELASKVQDKLRKT